MCMFALVVGRKMNVYLYCIDLLFYRLDDWLLGVISQKDIQDFC